MSLQSILEKSQQDFFVNLLVMYTWVLSLLCGALVGLLLTKIKPSNPKFFSNFLLNICSSQIVNLPLLPDYRTNFSISFLNSMKNLLISNFFQFLINSHQIISGLKNFAFIERIFFHIRINNKKGFLQSFQLFKLFFFCIFSNFCNQISHNKNHQKNCKSSSLKNDFSV